MKLLFKINCMKSEPNMHMMVVGFACHCNGVVFCSLCLPKQKARSKPPIPGFFGTSLTESLSLLLLS